MTGETLRIAVCGAHGSGKTSLIRAMQNQLKGIYEVHAITGLTRGIIGRGFPLGKNATVDSYVNYIRDQLHAERLNNGASCQFVLSDRVVLDAVAYAKVNQRIPRPYIPHYFIEMLEELWNLEALRFQAIIYVPIEFSMEVDGVREDDEEYRTAVDEEIRTLAHAGTLPCIEARGVLQTRVDTCIKLLRKLAKAPEKSANTEEVDSTPKPMPGAIPIAEFDLPEGDILSPYRDVIQSTIVRRLGGISFLGLIDQVYELQDRSDRLEHSIAVTKVAMEIADRLGLDDETREVWIICNILHDAGHSPFSHNSEPFLLETRRVYHTGVLSNSLRDDRGMQAWGARAALIRREDNVRTRVHSVLSRDGGDTLVEQIFYSPLNADKLDGNFRTARHLGLAFSVTAAEILSGFEMRNGEVFLQTKSLSAVREFWEMERKLYWELIYTDAVFGAEAILTRALHACYSSPKDVSEFIRSTDSEVLDRLSTNSSTARFAELLLTNATPRPLSKLAPDLYAKCSGQFQAVRFDLTERKRLERDIAQRLGLQASQVISHFSRRKHFGGSLDVVSQASLFEDFEDLLPLREIDSALRRTKVSGDFFEVFITD